MNWNAVENKWIKIRSVYPLLARELDDLNCSGEELKLLKVVYAGLDGHDLPSVEPGRMLEYVHASLQMRQEIPYAGDVPEDLFCSYVLPPRVNNEYLDGSRRWLYDKLKARVRGKSMLEAALEVNYWCCERAAYQSTDDRTIAPFGMCRRARGRCGEESTLLTCALRAVGIPARQVYVPLWAHCDDNHAWVEFWAGIWHHMGACEPEPVPDVGWFESAASRAMLVRSRVPDFEAESGYSVVNSTSRYAETGMLRVAVKKNGYAATGVPVRFQLINESRLASIHSDMTDENGYAVFETGFGCLIVSAFFDGRLVEQCVDLRVKQSISLEWSEGHDPAAEEWIDEWELIPPAEKLPAYCEENPAHQYRLHHCESVRSAYENTFVNDRSGWLALARGNHGEIAKFLGLQAYAMEDKETLLSTLAEKDFADVTSETLEDFLAAALPWKGRFSSEVWKNEILAPRVEHEMLLPIRRGIQDYFSDSGLQTTQEVYGWMRQNIRRIPEFGLTDRRGNALGYMRHGVCPESEWDILAVQICRSLGIPALLNRESENAVMLTVRCKEPLRFGENCSIAKWEAGEYRVLNPHAEGELRLEKGSYSLITARRQIDGTVSARAWRFRLTEDRELSVFIPPDQTFGKLKSVPLPVEYAGQNRPGLILFLQPGAEPTEHLLLELLELKDELNCGNWKIQLLTRTDAEAENETFRKLLLAIIGCTRGFFQSFEHYSIQTAMNVGDGRLPLAVVTDGDGNGVYACANYNIGSAHRMLHILRMIDQ